MHSSCPLHGGHPKGHPQCKDAMKLHRQEAGCLKAKGEDGLLSKEPDRRFTRLETIASSS